MAKARSNLIVLCGLLATLVVASQARLTVGRVDQPAEPTDKRTEFRSLLQTQLQNGYLCRETSECLDASTCTAQGSTDGKKRCRSATWLASQPSPSPSPSPEVAPLLLANGYICNTSSQCQTGSTCTAEFSTDGQKRCRSAAWLDSQTPSTPSPSPSPSPVPSTSGTIKTTGKFNKDQYKQVLGLSWLFYEAQRSGKLPADNRVPWRRSAHETDFVPGGWYDAGDYLKLNFPLGGTVTMLALGISEFEDAYKATGQYGHALKNLKVASDYLMDCHIDTRKYVGQIGHPDIDHDFWGRAEEENGKRAAYIYDSTKPASDLYGRVAAALAASAVVFKGTNTSYANELIKHAKEMYQWGVESNGGLYSNHYSSATASIYKSSDFKDDMFLGATFLYLATKDRTYLTEAEKWWKKVSGAMDVSIDWDNTSPLAAVVLASLYEDGVAVPSGAAYKAYVEGTFIKAWTQSNGFYDIVKTPKGMSRLSWSKWGNLRMVNNAGLAATVYAKHAKSSTTKTKALQWARSQADYAMGSSGRSFVVGFGDNFPQRPHHAGASCPDRPNSCGWAEFSTSKPNPQILYGALVGGPSGPGDDTYKDERDDYVTNEVTSDYNAGFTGVLAGLYQLTA